MKRVSETVTQTRTEMRNILETWEKTISKAEVKLDRLEATMASAIPPPPSPKLLVDIFRTIEDEVSATLFFFNEIIFRNCSNSI